MIISENPENLNTEISLVDAHNLSEDNRDNEETEENLETEETQNGSMREKKERIRTNGIIELQSKKP